MQGEVWRSMRICGGVGRFVGKCSFWLR